MSIFDQQQPQQAVLYIKAIRRDGKYPVSYRYGNGKVLNKIQTFEAVKLAADSGTYELAGMSVPFKGA